MNNDNGASLTSDVGRHHAGARCGKRYNPDQLQHTHFFFQEELNGTLRRSWPTLRKTPFCRRPRWGRARRAA